MTSFEKALLAELKNLRKEIHGLKNALTPEQREGVNNLTEEPPGTINGINIKRVPDER